MSEKSEKRSTRQKKTATSLEQLAKTKGKKQNRLDQFEVEEVDEAALIEKKPTETKKTKKRKKRNEQVETSKPIPSIFLNQQKKTTSPPNKKMKPQESYLTNIMAELGDDEDDEDFENDLMDTETTIKQKSEPISQDSEEEDEVESPPPKPVSGKSKPLIPVTNVGGKTTKPLIPVTAVASKETRPLIPILSNPGGKANLNQNLTMPSTHTLKTENVKDISLKSNFQMYFLDAYEERNLNDGTVYLFGKVQENNEYKSCCVVVKNLQRNIFLLPKGGEEEISEDDVDDEIERLMKEQKIQSYRYKMTDRNYAFEKEGVPHGINKYVKLVYPGTSPALKFEEDNKLFSHAFGQNTSLLELFLIKRKIKGPMWIEIKNSTAVNVPVSWCHSEAICLNPKDINVLKEQLPTPSLKLMSIKTRTVLNEKTNNNEIIMISGLCHSNVTIDTNCDVDKDLSKFTLMKRLETSGSIPTLKDEIIQVYKNETDLLEHFIEKMYSFDPDILVGHNFLAFDLDIFLHRMNSKNISNWSKLGRLKRKQLPKLQSGPGGVGTLNFSQQLILSGRLVCDTYISSKDYLRESNYSLKSLAKSQLGEKVEELVVINNDISSIQPYYENEKTIIILSRNNEYFTYVSMLLMFKLNLLPLTKELSNAAGNLWSKSLIGNSSERIEYLLLHEFHSKKFIVPDKMLFKKKDSNTTVNSKKKAEYSGGLVIQPQKGLYDTYVLLLDFNSLYPSIILEKNLCFTTVIRKTELQTDEQNGDGGDIGGIKENVDSVLPKVIKSLLERRKNVKKLMNSEKDSSKKWQLNIKQNALKLIANSTYGCLGFSSSRFYCKTIAEMITAFGRDNLNRTKSEIEDKLGHQVIYGDTDSVMVLTPFTDFKKASLLGHEIIKHINKQHEHLQLGIDGLFRKILLLEKKRYVAILHVEDESTQVGYTCKTEKKGIEMVRRDWCELTKDASQVCIDQILGDDLSNEQVVNSIHDYLRNLSKNIKDIPIEKFILSKELSKEPKDYPDAKQLPHVMIAKRMIENGEPIAVKQRIQYVICTLKNDDTKLSLSERAYHIDEFEKKSDELEIDYKWYLSAQIHPPITRLCKYIEGTNASLLAECLGLDHQQIVSFRTDDDDDTMMNWMQEEEEKYKNIQITDLKCSYCQEKIEMNLNERILNILKNQEENEELNYLECSNCNKKCSTGKICNWIVNNIRNIQDSYYKNNSVQTTTISMKNDHYYSSGSLHSISTSNIISSSDLYLHLNYFYHLFDYESTFERLFEHEKNSKDLLTKIKLKFESSNEMESIDYLKKKSEFYLSKCGFRYIDTKNLFNIFNLLENKD